MKKAKRIIGVVVCILVIIGGVVLYQKTHPGFWDVNELRITQDFDVIEDDEKAQTVLDQEKMEKGEIASKDLVQEINKIKKGMRKFFFKKYKIDVKDKLNKLEKVYVFSSNEYKGQSLGGYVDEEKNTVNLNEEFVKDENKWKTVFIHETIHYLGVREKGSNHTEYLIEGITDALAEDCCNYLKITFYATNFYQLQRMLAHQILIVDPQLVNETIKNGKCDMENRINDRLKDIDFSIIEVDNIAVNLESCISSLFQGTSQGSEEIIILQAQDIVSSYCKTFSPSKEKIEKIREYYVMNDYEKIKVVIQNNIIYLETP